MSEKKEPWILTFAGQKEKKRIKVLFLIHTEFSIVIGQKVLIHVYNTSSDNGVRQIPTL